MSNTIVTTYALEMLGKRRRKSIPYDEIIIGKQSVESDTTGTSFAAVFRYKGKEMACIVCRRMPNFDEGESVVLKDLDGYLKVIITQGVWGKENE